MKPYSNDLRARIVDAYENNDHSQPEIANLFGVSLSTVKSLIRRKRETGSTDALPHSGGASPALDLKAQSFVQQLVKQNNDITLQEAVEKVHRKHKKKVSLSTMCRVLQKLDLPRKKSRSTPLSARVKEFNKLEASTLR